MQYVRYGTDGPKVSRLGFGVMRLPARKRGGWGQPNLVRGPQLLREAMQGGVNFLDTHHFYHGGLSEVAIGKALRGWKGPRPIIQTKTPYYRKDKPQKWFTGINPATGLYKTNWSKGDTALITNAHGSLDNCLGRDQLYEDWPAIPLQARARVPMPMPPTPQFSPPRTDILDQYAVGRYI